MLIGSDGLVYFSGIDMAVTVEASPIVGFPQKISHPAELTGKLARIFHIARSLLDDSRNRGGSQWPNLLAFCNTGNQ